MPVMNAQVVVEAGRVLRHRWDAGLLRARLRRQHARALRLERPARGRTRAVLPILILVSLYYAFLGSSGRFVDLPIAHTNYYDRLAQGFAAGHLYLPEPPSSALLMRANPYAAQNVSHWVWDASLYGKHYYLYFGPVPALLLLALRSVAFQAGVITDQWPTILFLLGRFYAGSGLLVGLANRLKVPPPTWLLVLSVAVFGLAHPVPYVAMRPSVWEAALAGGQCFLFIGLWLAFVALGTPKHRRICLLLAGSMWGLAIGCRATMAIPTPALVLVTLGMLWYSGRRGRSWLLDALSLAVPFAALCALHGWYNWARFGSAFEFGIRYQTTLQPFRGSSSYVLPNLYAYLFTVPLLSCRFPFVGLPAQRVMPDWIGNPLGYATFEQLGGLLFLAPWIVLTPVGAWFALRRRRLADPLGNHSFSPTEVWLGLSCVAIVPSMIPVLHLWLAAPRYPGDAVGGLIILASIFAYFLARTFPTASSRRGRVLRVVVPALGITTCLLSALTAFAISTRSFPILNPLLYQKIESTLSLCPAGPAHGGPI